MTDGLQPPFSPLVRLYHRVGTQIEALRALCEGPREDLVLRRAEVSGWAVAQHLEHLATTGGQVLRAVDRSLADEAPGGRPKLLGYAVLATGWIPRGRVRARKEWSPADADPERAGRGVAELARSYAALETRLPAVATARGALPHPFLGPFTPRHWLRFLEVHQNHHLKIIGDVLRAAGRDGSGVG